MAHGQPSDIPYPLNANFCANPDPNFNICYAYCKTCNKVVAVYSCMYSVYIDDMQFLRWSATPATIRTVTERSA